MRISRRPLPAPDASVDSLSDDDRRLLVQSWSGRADAERTAVDSFRLIATALRDAGAESKVVALAERAVDDEEWHSQICHRMASIFHGAELPEPKAHPFEPPRHEGASEVLRRTLHVVGQCCLNETTATVFYETCLAGATSRHARAALRALLSDEIDHARIGWAHLASPSLTPEIRTGVMQWLPALVDANLRSWRRRLQLPDRPALVANGSPAYATGMEAVGSALRDLVRPGLARLGYDVTTIPSELPPAADTITR